MSRLNYLFWVYLAMACVRHWWCAVHSLEVREGESAVLSCNTPDGARAVTWCKEDTPFCQEKMAEIDGERFTVFPPWTEDTLQRHGPQSIRITTVSYTRDEGVYWCEGSSFTQKFTLRVTRKQDNILLRVYTIPTEYSRDEEVTLVCSADSNTPSELSWTFQGRLLTVSNKSVNMDSLKINTNVDPASSIGNPGNKETASRAAKQVLGTDNKSKDRQSSGQKYSAVIRYYITRLSQSDQGRYVCTAKNSDGSTVSQSLTLLADSKNNSLSIKWTVSLIVGGLAGCVAIIGGVITLIVCYCKHRKADTPLEQETCRPQTNEDEYIHPICQPPRPWSLPSLPQDDDDCADLESCAGAIGGRLPKSRRCLYFQNASEVSGDYGTRQFIARFIDTGDISPEDSESGRSFTTDNLTEGCYTGPYEVPYSSREKQTQESTNESTSEFDRESTPESILEYLPDCSHQCSFQSLSESIPVYESIGNCKSQPPVNRSSDSS